MIPEKIGFIGLGHIGGSVAKTVHRIYPDIQIVAAVPLWTPHYRKV